jgi:Anti-sigma-K factor rskA
VSHTDPEILALLALGETAGTPHDVEHARTCAPCQDELARLSGLVDLARRADPGERLEQPPPQLWDKIAAAAGGGVTVVEPPGLPPARATRSGLRAHRRPGRLAGVLAGVAAGLIIGAGATAGIIHLTSTAAPRVVAQVELSPLPQFPQWHGASGTAVMKTASGQQEMAVTLRAPQRPGFYEVWLLARDGVSMISLGDLNASHTGTFTIPPGVDLRNYSRIDVSLQQFDGSTLHAKTSVVRGSLPPAAVGA